MVEASLVNLAELAVLTVGVAIALMQLSDISKTRETELETRQLQLYTTILNISQSKEYYRSYLDFMYNQEWEDYDDFMRKYGPVSNPEAYLNYIHTLGLFQQFGVLVEQKAFDPHILYRHSGENLFRVWEKMEPLVYEFRERVSSKWLQSFESLYHEMKKIQQQEES